MKYGTNKPFSTFFDRKHITGQCHQNQFSFVLAPSDITVQVWLKFTQLFRKKCRQ